MKFKVSGIVLVITLVFSLAGMASALEYPTKKIEMVCYSAAGGGTDVFVRTACQLLEPIINGQIIVSNMPGGAGTRGTTYVMGKPADGYTLLACTSTISASYYRGAMEYSYDDLIPIAMGMNEVQSVAVRADSPLKTADDLVAAIKSGQVIKWATSNLGSIDHFVAYAITKGLGKSIDDMQVIPFSSGSEALLAGLSGAVDAMVNNPSELMGQVDAGQVRILMILGDRRSKFLPNVPTAREVGLDYVLGTWRGVAVKKGTPPEIVELLRNGFKQVFQSEKYKKYLEFNLMDENWLIGDDFGEFIAWDAEFTRQAIEDLGLKE